MLENINEDTVYIKLDDYKDVFEMMEVMKEKLMKVKETMSMINELRQHEETELEIWKNSVSEIENKFAFIENALFETRKKA